MKKVIKIIGIAVGVIIVLAIILGGEKKTTEELKAPEELKRGWSYRESEDGMDGSKRYFANITSTNKIQFQFPYNVKGGSSFELTVRNMKNKNEVLLKAEKGHFMGKTCRVKFDDTIVNYGTSGTSDLSSGLIFFDNPKKFIGSLKTAKKLNIECEFFQEGNRIIEFDDVQGLEWDR
jgi:hypothetical protein